MTADTAKFYAHLFTNDPFWSSPFPNNNEVLRLAKVLEYLSLIVQWMVPTNGGRLRILDVGCGRGWLTQAASAYGNCNGLEPVAEVADRARQLFPHLGFITSDLSDHLKSPAFVQYDVVIASEVIEHVSDKQVFARELGDSVVSAGYLILTTPRGELYKRWLRLGYEKQPIEEWESEKGVRKLFAGHGFKVIDHGRVYLDLPSMSLLHLACASPSGRRLMERFGLDWFRAGLLYMAGFYQTWLFRKVRN